jgi:hypothetical protein
MKSKKNHIGCSIRVVPAHWRSPELRLCCFHARPVCSTPGVHDVPVPLRLALLVSGAGSQHFIAKKAALQVRGEDHHACGGCDVFGNLESKQTMGQAIKTGEGEVILSLSPEQHKKITAPLIIKWLVSPEMAPVLHTQQKRRRGYNQR